VVDSAQPGYGPIRTRSVGCKELLYRVGTLLSRQREAVARIERNASSKRIVVTPLEEMSPNVGELQQPCRGHAVLTVDYQHAGYVNQNRWPVGHHPNQKPNVSGIDPGSPIQRTAPQLADRQVDDIGP
jgi:hypothetical protein